MSISRLDVVTGDGFQPTVSGCCGTLSGSTRQRCSICGTHRKEAAVLRRSLVSGPLGAIFMVLWAFVVNAGSGLRSGMGMNRIPDPGRRDISDWQQDIEFVT
jgi:hypothetical protein